MNELLLRTHLGLGDAIVCNGLIRFLAQSNHVYVLSKHHNVTSVGAMFKDLESVTVFGIANDEEADNATAHAEGLGYRVLRIGLTGQKPFNVEEWDKELYRQAGVPFENSYSMFSVPRNWKTELSIPDRKFVFVHEDTKRNFVINRKLLKTTGYRNVFADASKTDNIWDWRGIIENAEQLHIIDSAFAIMIDRLPNLKAKKIVLHDYARNGKPPSYRRTFERISK